MSHPINITGFDEYDTLQEVPVYRNFDTIAPQFFANVIDLASIVGNHNVSREAQILEYEPVDYLFPGLPIFRHV